MITGLRDAEFKIKILSFALNKFNFDEFEVNLMLLNLKSMSFNSRNFLKYYSITYYETNSNKLFSKALKGRPKG